MKYEVRDRNGDTVAIFEDKGVAQSFASQNGYSVVEVTLTEETQLASPSFLTE